MSVNTLRRPWQAGQSAIGTFVFSRDPDTTELIGQAGLDFAIIDMEHAPLGITEVSAHLRAAKAAGISALVRLPGPDPALMGKLLDAGAHGLLLPHFGKDEAASEAFGSVLRYAPEGERPSCTGVRAAGFGIGSYADYVAQANQDLVAIGLVEDVEVVPRLGSILARSRIDAVMPGPGDLSTSMGLYGQPTHPRVREAVRQIIDTARHAQLRVGMYLNSPQEVADWAALNLDFYVYLLDMKLLAQSYQRAASDIRAGLRKSG